MLRRFFQSCDCSMAQPGWYEFVFGNLALAPLWTLARLYLGWQWLQAGWHKVEGDGWLNQDGAALQGFWERIVVVPEEGRAPVRYDWYRDFIQFMLDNDWYTWFAVLIAVGEVVVGIALIMGALTGLAALSGAFMNFNFMLAGTASTNPVLFLLAILMLLSWRVSGHIGLDRWLLPLLRAPWRPRPFFVSPPPADMALGSQGPPAQA